MTNEDEQRRQVVGTADILDKIVSAASEMGDDGLTRDELAKAIAGGNTVIEEYPHGFAVVNVEGSGQVDPGAFLWLFYVDPDRRGEKIGRAMLKDIINKFAPTYFMRLKRYSGCVFPRESR